MIFHLFAGNCDSVHFVSQDIDEDITGKEKFYLKFKDIKPEGTNGWKKFKKCKFVATNDIAERIIDPRIGLYDVVVNKSQRCFTEYAFSSVFEHCGLSQISIPDVVTRMDSRFSGFSSLRNVIFSDAIIEIGSSAFRGCEKLESVLFTGEESLKYIKDLAFEGCEKLQHINFPINMEEIGYCAFQGCRSLHFINIRSLNKIGVKAFSQCTSLQEVDFNFFVKTIDDRAFEDCKKLTHVILPDSLIELGENVFSGCTSLRSISFPGSLERIESVCNGCSSLRRVFLSEGVKIIRASAFNNLPLLDKLVLPNSLEEIGEYAFSGCRSLKVIAIPPLVKVLNCNTFDECDALKKVIVPRGTKIVGSWKLLNDCSDNRESELTIVYYDIEEWDKWRNYSIE